MTRPATAAILSAATLRATAQAVLDAALFRGEAIGNLRVHKVWPKPGDRFVVLYAAAGPRGAVWAAAHLFPPDKILDRADVPPSAAHVPEWNGFVQRFPHDYRMRHLRTAMDRTKAGAIISPLVGGRASRAGFSITSAAPRGYWPGKRCQIEYRWVLPSGESGRLFAKVYREENGRAMTALHRALRKAGLDGRRGLSVPRPVAYCRELRASLMEPGEGGMLWGLLDTPAAPQISFRAGHLLAILHGLDVPPPNPAHGPEDEIGLLNGWRRAVGLVSPSRARIIALGLDRLAETVPAARTPLRTSHRDFYDKQILWDGDQVTLLDFDTACPAPAELDAGNFLAHLALRGMQQAGDADRYRDLETPFVEGYLGSGGRLSPPSLAWFRAASLLRLACHDAIQPGGAPYFDRLISLARPSAVPTRESICRA